MKYIWLVIVTVLSVFISCTQIVESEKQSCYVGRIRISKHCHSESYNIYVSLKMVNNTNDTLFLPTSDSIVPFPRSAFVGCLYHDKIKFSELGNRSKILPKDSIYIRLVSLYYKPKTNDSIFLKEIQKVKVEYEYPNSKPQIPCKYIKEINIQRTPKTKFEILEDDKSIEGIFLFGNEEFK